MIKEFADYLVPNPYSPGMNCPKGTCTYRDDLSYFVFYDSSALYSADMLRGRIDNAVMDRIFYHDPWADGKEPRWIVERQTVSERACTQSVIASRSWLKLGYVHPRFMALKEKEVKAILRGFRTSPMGEVVTDIIKNSLVSQGYDEIFWDYVERKKEPILKAVVFCDQWRKTLAEKRKDWVSKL